MKRIAMLMIVATLLTGWTACVPGDGVAITRAERANRHRRTRELDRKMLNDDLDLLMLNDRPSRLTEWKVD